MAGIAYYKVISQAIIQHSVTHMHTNTQPFSEHSILILSCNKPLQIPLILPEMHHAQTCRRKIKILKKRNNRQLHFKALFYTFYVSALPAATSLSAPTGIGGILGEGHCEGWGWVFMLALVSRVGNCPKGAHSSTRARLKVCEPSGQSHRPQQPYTGPSMWSNCQPALSHCLLFHSWHWRHGARYPSAPHRVEASPPQRVCVCSIVPSCW